jgi:cytochrome c oxidase cbb3-type subunit 3
VAHRPDELLEHEADGIREFDNQLPRWWLYGFYFTIAFSIAYLVNYHVLPSPLVGSPGMIAEYEAELEAASRTAAARPAPSTPSAPAAVEAATDEATLRKGEEIFNSPANLCSSCHRPDLGGLVGPNLTDEYWLHGCSVGEVVSSIRTGYPTMGMLPYGSNTPLDDGQLVALASYILSKRGTAPPGPKPHDPQRDTICD